jgi:hypothetical protein
MSRPSFAAIGIYYPGERKLSLMSVQNRVVVFDHAAQIKDYMPLLGGGRVTQWRDAETAYWMPYNPLGINHACIVRNYDPYHLPPGMPILSEAHHREWRYHIHAAYIFHDCGQMVQRADGSYANTMLGEK